MSMKIIDVAARHQVDKGVWKFPRHEVERKLAEKVKVVRQKKAPSNEELKVQEMREDEMISTGFDSERTVRRVQVGSFVEVRRYAQQLDTNSSPCVSEDK